MMSNALERALLRGPTFQEGADFFLRLKTAGWTDPPDTSGVLEGTFAAPVEQVIDKLKEVITSKARLMLAWYTYAQSFKGDAWRSIKDEFHEHAEDEQRGLDFYLKRAAALAGPIHYNDIEPPPPASEPQAIFALLARAVQEGIQVQRELRQLAGDENPMKIGIEEQLALDQHHLDEMWQMMPQGTQTGMPGLGDPAGGGLPVAPEAPIEEAPGPQEATTPVEEKAAMALLSALLKQAAESEKDKALKATGRDRAVTNMAAEAHREAGRRGERAGAALGGIGGAFGGAALGKKLKAPMGLGPVLGAGAGYLAGKGLGKEVGTEVDIARNKSKTAAPAFAHGQGLKRVGQLLTGSRAKALNAQAKDTGARGFKVTTEILKGRAKEESRKVLGARAGAGAAGGALVGAGVAASRGKDKTAGVADVAPAFGGLSAGYGAGSHAAQTTAEAISPDSRDEQSGRLARRAAMVAAPAAGLGAMVAAHKMKAVPRVLAALKKLSPGGTLADPAVEAELARLLVPAGAAAGGSLLGGALAGGAIGGGARAMGPTQKVAFGSGGYQPQLEEAVPPALAVNGEEEPAAEGAPPPDPNGGPPDLEGQHYLEAEQLGRQAQEENEAAFYRERFQQAMQNMNGMQGDVQQLQGELEQLQQQTVDVNNQISERTQQAVEANVEATRQAQTAANLRIGLEKMRQQMLEVAAQDPELLAQPEPVVDPGMDPGMVEEGAPGGPAADAAGAEGAPGTAPPAAGSESPGREPARGEGSTGGTVVNVSSEPSSKKEASVSADAAAFGARIARDAKRVAPWALSGAAAGAYAGHELSQRAPGLRSKLETLTASPRAEGDFETAKTLGKEYSRLAKSEKAESNPRRAMILGGLGGAFAMSSMVPQIIRSSKNIKKSLNYIATH